MSLLWPGFLYLLLLIPLMIAVYILALRRRRRFTVRYSSLSLVREAATKQSWLRRHLRRCLISRRMGSLRYRRPGSRPMTCGWKARTGNSAS